MWMVRLTWCDGLYNWFNMMDLVLIDIKFMDRFDVVDMGYDFDNIM